MVSLLYFTNKRIEALIENYQESNGIYINCCELTFKFKEYKPLVVNAANPPIITVKEGYTATHNCEFLPLITESYLKSAASHYSGSISSWSPF